MLFRCLIFCCFAVFVGMPVRAGELTSADYARAERLLPGSLGKLIYNEHFIPRWIGETDRFWYRSDDPDGQRFYLVDPAGHVREPAFDQEKVAAAISRQSGQAIEAHQLPFRTIEFNEDCTEVEFTIDKQRWTCDRETGVCTHQPAEETRSVELRSPDKRWALTARDHNLFLRGVESGTERQLTDDGQPHYAYGAEPEGRTTAVADRLRGRQRPPSAVWSPDSKWILTHRLDERRVLPMHLIQSTNLGDDNHRPILHTYRFPLVGDEHVAVCEPVLIHVEEGTVVRVKVPPHHTPYRAAISLRDWWWSEDGQRVYLLRNGRGRKSVTLERVDPATGESRQLIEESRPTYVESKLSLAMRPNIRELDGGRQILWRSERDGWAHLYLYDAETGQLVRQVTSGAWAVQQVLHVDHKTRQVYFTVNGAPDVSNPYHRQLYVAHLDKAEVRRLSKADAFHRVSFSPSGSYYVETASRMNSPGITTLRSTAVPEYEMELAKTDVSRLEQMGVRLPVPFRAKAADNTTDIYGAIYFPSHYDPQKSYPVVDALYPGPQTNRTPESLSGTWLRRIGGDMALAELGFIVVNVDGRGKPGRSKAFHDFQYGKLELAGSLQDHIAAIRQLADRYPSMDLERVGVHGHSGGGFATARALFAYPKFYKVGVSSAGNHDQRGYLSQWGERYHGLAGEADYEKQANATIAGNLQGKLLLVFGELDDNVHPALTIQVIDALTKANKDYDLLIVPHAHHDCSRHPYFVRRLWDYFVTHLQGSTPPAGYAIDAASVFSRSP